MPDGAGFRYLDDEPVNPWLVSDREPPQPPEPEGDDHLTRIWVNTHDCDLWGTLDPWFDPTETHVDGQPIYIRYDHHLALLEQQRASLLPQPERVHPVALSDTRKEHT